MYKYAIGKMEELDTGYHIDVLFRRGYAWWDNNQENGSVQAEIWMDIAGKARNASFDRTVQVSGAHLADLIRNDRVSISEMSGNKKRFKFNLIFNCGDRPDEQIYQDIQEHMNRYRADHRYDVISFDVTQQITPYIQNNFIMSEGLMDIQKWTMLQVYELLRDAGIKE